MRDFDLNELEVEQIEDPRLDDYLIGSPGNLGFDEGLTDDEYDAATGLQEATLERLSEVLQARGTGLEIVRVDMVDYFDFMLVRRGETESEFADRVFG